MQKNPVSLAAIALSLAITLLLAVVTASRNRIWKDESRLYDDAMRKSPRKSRVFYNAGVHYDDEGDLDRAERYYRRATQLDETNSDLRESTWYNLGVIYMKQARGKPAIDAFTRAISIDPNDAAALYRRGLVLQAVGSPAQGQADIDRALQLNPQVEEEP